MTSSAPHDNEPASLVALVLSHYHYLIELSLDAIVLETKDAISFSNSTAQRMLGVTAHDLVGRRIDEFLEPVFLAAMHDEMRKPGAERMPFIARRLRRADGKAIEVEVAAVPFTFEEGRSVQVVLRQAAETAQRPAGVAFAESQFRIIADQMPLVVWACDLDGRIISVAGDEASPLGVRANEALRAREGLPLDGAHDAPAQIGSTSQPAPSTINVEGRSYALRVEPLRDARAGVVGRVGVAFDVTQWLQVQEFRREAARAHAIGQLAGGVAHEINNVLAIISTNAQLLVDKPESASATAANVIVEATTRAAEITRNLLAFAMREVHIPVLLTLHDLIRSVTDSLATRAPPSVTIELKLGAALHHVTGDAVGLSRALTNICVNAFDAMPDGGKLTIETSEVRARSTPGDTETSEVEVRVSDTGIGMNESTRVQAFEPFFSAFPDARHVGLGLSMVHGVVAQHGGTVRLDSVLGAGTTVTLRLPSVAPPMPVAAVSLRIPSGRLRDVSARGKVLVVDDEPMLRRLSMRMLGTFGYECVEAPNGAAAVARFRESPGEFACVLLDVVMPIMSGVEALSHLLVIDPDVRVVLCTGYFRDELSTDAFASGAIAYLGKPYLLHDLRAAIDKVTGHIRIAA